MTDKRIQCTACSSQYLAEDSDPADGPRCPTCGSDRFREVDGRDAVDVKALQAELEQERARRAELESKLSELGLLQQVDEHQERRQAPPERLQAAGSAAADVIPIGDGATLGTSEADGLMDAINRSPMTKIVLLSLGIHLALLLLTSVRYLALCTKHGTLDPKARIAEMKAAEDEAAREAERQEALEAIAKKQKAAEEAAAGAAMAGDGEKSPIEKAVEEVSTERPDPSAPSLDFEFLD